jgi:ArsR family transcriptional regulator
VLDDAACAPVAPRKRVSAKEARAQSELCKVLADETRLRIVVLLAGQDELCACDVEACFDLSQPTISHHLRVLKDAGLVSSERRGAWVYYRVQRGALAPLASLVRLLDTSSTGD